MAGYTLSVHYDAPQNRVFDLMAELERTADRVSAVRKIEMLTDGPVGVGTRFRETRKVFGREETEEMEIVEFDPGNGYTVGCTSCGAYLTWRFTLGPAATGGTDLQFSLDIKPITLFAKITTPLSGLMMRSFKKAMVRDLEDLRPYIEGDGAAPTAHAAGRGPDD